MNLKIKTVGDVQDARQLANSFAEHRAVVAYNAKLMVTAKLGNNPEIGILNGDKGVRYYAYIGGYNDSNYIVHTDIDVILSKLGRIS